MTEEMSLAQIGEIMEKQLQNEFSPTDPEIGKLADRFEGKVAEEAPEPADEPEPEAPEWVHEPTGKVFKSELDMLRYESGWKTQQYGERLKKLEDRPVPKEEPKQMSRDDFKRAILPNLSEDDLKDPLVDIVFDAAMNVADLQHRVMSQRVEAMQSEFSKLAERFDQTQARAAAGIDAAAEEEMLNKYPELANLAFVDRVSVLKRLRGELESATKAAPKPPRASEYVEGSSAQSEIPESGDSFLGEFKKLDEQQQLKVLGEMTAREGFLKPR